MTKKQFSEDAQRWEADQIRASDFLRITRREAIAVGAGGIALLTNLNDRAQADVEGRREAVSQHNSGADHQQQTLSRADGNAPRTEQRPQQHVQENRGIDTLLGSEFRAPTCGIQTLTTNQLYATGTREGPPDRRVVGRGEYFSDGFNLKLMSNGENLLATALRAPSRLPEGVTISIGAEFKFPERIGQPGSTPFYLKMVEVSKKGVGQSNTLGIGTSEGVFVTVSSVNGQQSWSVGLYGGAPKAVVMESINLTDLAKKGELVIEEGVLVSVKAEVEISGEVRPIQEAYEVFSKVLGPLSDYRNFQDPLHGF
jgi:hypothetical protein